MSAKIAWVTLAALGLAAAVSLWVQVAEAESDDDAALPQAEAGDDAELSQAVRATLSQLYPDGQIREVETERVVMNLVEVAVQVDDQMKELLLTDDGRLVEVEQRITAEDLPASVREALGMDDPALEVNEIEQVQVHATLDVASLDQPRTEYEVQVEVKDRQQQIRLSDQGQVLNTMDNGGGERKEHDD